MPSLAAAEHEAAYADFISRKSTKSALGSELRVGNVIEVWWNPKRDTVTKITPYTGPLAHLWPSGALTVEFALNTNGMTIGCDEPVIMVT